LDTTSGHGERIDAFMLDPHDDGSCDLVIYGAGGRLAMRCPDETGARLALLDRIGTLQPA
jgi:hypothetical protein